MRFESASFSGSTATQRRREIKETFFSIVKRAKEKDVDFLFIAGDLFENEYITAGELKEIKRAFEAFDNTKVINIAGNHDPLTPGTKYDLIDLGDNVYNVKGVFEKLVFDDKKVCIYASSWNSPSIVEALLDDIIVDDKEMINILVAHGDVYSKTSSYLPIDKDKILKAGFDYVALGHFHKHDNVTERMIYPGSPEPLDFGETGEHGIIEGSIDKEHIDVKFIPFSKREFKEVEIVINSDMTRKDILDKILSYSDDNNLFRIILDGSYGRDVDMDIHEMRDELLGSFYHVEIINKAVEDLDIEQLYRDNKDIPRQVPRWVWQIGSGQACHY